jgi:subtilisin-like proprotein convertase family protein
MRNNSLPVAYLALLFSAPLLFAQAKPTSPRLAESLSAVELVANSSLNPANEEAAAQFDETFSKPIQINDGRQRSSVLAEDELYQPTPDGVGQIVPIKESSKPSTLASVANILALEKKQETRLILYPANATRNESTRRTASRDIVVRFKDRETALRLANQAGLRLSFEAPYALGVATFTADSQIAALLALQQLRTEGLSCSLKTYSSHMKFYFLPDDALFNNQWHIRGRGQNGAKKASDARITPVWEQRDSAGNLIRGTGVTIGITDSGYDFDHPDLVSNNLPAMGYDWGTLSSGGVPRGTSISDSHGTAVAGVSAARGYNGVGVSGVAPWANLVSQRIDFSSSTWGDETESKTFGYGEGSIRIKNNSWGNGTTAPDSATMDIVPPSYTLGALAAEANSGTMIIFAAGNELREEGNTNFHYEQNSIYTISVAALNDFARQADYSTPGASVLISAPSGLDTDTNNPARRVQGTTTTDRVGDLGYNTLTTTNDYTDPNYTKNFNGTSSAAPVVSGVTALILQANSSLNWRDVKEIYIRSATKNDSGDSDWARNGAGFWFNHKYGAGLINASDAVRLAKNWSNLGTMTSVSVPLSSLPATIRDNNSSGLVKYFDTRSLSGLRVEHATVTTDISHPSRGELQIQLTSPAGTTSRLAEKHTSYVFDPADYPDWTFSTVHNWGEDSRGLWKLKIADRVSGNTGTLDSATLTLYGTAK